MCGEDGFPKQVVMKGSMAGRMEVDEGQAINEREKRHGEGGRQGMRLRLLSRHDKELEIDEVLRFFN
jgi:hypothetical protein